MTTFVYRKGKIISKEEATPLLQIFGEAPMVISDAMDATRHMATGRYHTSKAAFRADTKAAGCIEFGNDPALYRPRKPVPLSRKQRREDIKKTIYNLRNGIKQ